MKSSDKPVVVEQIFDSSPPLVWNAITQVDQMRQWYFDNIPAFKPETGFQTKFNVNSGERNFLHIWTVTEVQPEKKIVYNWKYDGYAGDSFVTFELAMVGNSTKLTVTAKVTESFLDDIPEFSRESCIGGWEYFIKGRLKEFLDKVS